MNARFPILSLTHVTFEKIVMLLDPSDIFELAQSSEKCHNLVKNTTKLFRKTVNFDISLFPGISYVRVCSNGMTLFDWELYNKRNKMRLELEDLKPRIINRASDSKKPIVFYRKKIGKYASVYTDPEEVLKIAQYLADLFNLSVRHLCYQRHHHLDSLLSYDMIKKGRLEFVEIGQGVVSHSELIQILEGFGDRTLHMYKVNTQSGFVYDKMISRRGLKLQRSNWFTGRMLVNFDCEYADLTIYDVEEEDINQLLLQIMNSSSHKLKTMAISKERLESEDESDLDQSEEMEPFDIDKITEGLDEFHEEHADFEGEITRRFKKTDGTFVNVEVENNYSYNSILLWTGLFNSYSEAL